MPVSAFSRWFSISAVNNSLRTNGILATRVTLTHFRGRMEAFKYFYRLLPFCFMHFRSWINTWLLHLRNRVLSAYNQIFNKYVSGDWPISDPTSTRREIFHERRIFSVTFPSAHLYGNVYIPVGVARALSDSSDFGLLGEQSSQKCVIPCLGRRWTAEKNLTPLALSSAEKSVTIQTNKHTQKAQKTIYPHLA